MMRKFMMGVVAALGLGAAGATMAGESGRLLSEAPDRISGKTIRTKLENLGYRVDRLEAERGCWEARAVNDSGFPIKVKFDMATGDLVRAELRSKH